jgi:heparan-alpha-glucosaminide N-acetyltransferase
MNELPKRLLSIDVFRAITMLLMIFVNDVSGVAHIPAWIEHTQANEDGMGFADSIFPTFLFIVGLSLPFAIKNRLAKGLSTISTAWYIVGRSAALIIMGFFHVNSENYSSRTFIPHSVWMLLITISFFLIWLDYPPTLDKKKRYGLITVGILLLLAMAWYYEGSSYEAPETMKPHWWGILGIIGWAYLVCALAFLITKGNFIAQTIILAVFVLINLFTHLGWLPFSIPVIGDASSVSLIMAGVVTTSLYSLLAGKKKSKQLWSSLTIIGLAMIVLGFVIRPFAGGISKIHSTPAWVFICGGIAVLVFELLIWLVDVKGKQNWFKIIKPAGTSTLTCYLIPYILLSAFSLLHFNFPQWLNEGIGGIVRSFGIAFLVILIVGLMEKKRIRLKV